MQLQVTPLIPLTQPIPVIDEEVEDEHVSYMENLISQKNEFYSLDWPGGDVSVERVEAVAPTKLSLKPKKKKGVSVEHVEAVAPTKQSLKPKKNLKPKKKKGVSVEHVETVAPTKLSLKPKKKKGKKISSARKRLFNKRLEEQVNHLSIQVANLTSLTSLFKKILSRRHGFRSARNSKFTTTRSSGKKHDQLLPPLPHEVTDSTQLSANLPFIFLLNKFIQPLLQEENHHILDVAAYNHLNNDPDHHMTFPTDHLTPASPTKTSFSFDEPFEEVIYPKGDPYVVSICKSDVDLLQPETFVNDTIIDFYINYLKNQIQGEERPRLHFFNSFLFRKLADLDKDPSSIADGKATFLRVRKWTRKVDMFGKDYIFVPVNFNLHWSLIIICHPGEVANCTGLDFDDSTKVPCILHMDSVKGSHAGLENLVQSYLCEEWKERHKGTSDDISTRFMNLRFVSLEVPQQENSYDCGLFLLHYLELFLAEAPQNFSPFKIHNASNFLYLNWFPPAEASSKRTLIEKLIFELLENHSRETQDQGIDAYRSVNPDPKCQSPAGQTLNPDHDHLTCTPDHITFPTDHHLAPVSSTKTSYGGQSSSSSHQNISDHMQRDPPSPKNPDHTCQSIDTPAGPAANQSPKGLGFNARATVLNAFTAKATTSPGHNTGFNPKATTSNTPYIPDELVCLSDSCEARKKPKHIPTEPERILATHLLKCQTVPAKTVIGYVDNNLWELFYKTIKASKNVLHIYPQTTTTFTNNFLLELSTPQKQLDSTRATKEASQIQSYEVRSSVSKAREYRKENTPRESYNKEHQAAYHQREDRRYGQNPHSYREGKESWRDIGRNLETSSRYHPYQTRENYSNTSRQQVYREVRRLEPEVRQSVRGPEEHGPLYNATYTSCERVGKENLEDHQEKKVFKQPKSIDWSQLTQEESAKRQASSMQTYIGCRDGKANRGPKAN
ncbi:hypothetical protein Bca101_038068 [Brassica carinata]